MPLHNSVVLDLTGLETGSLAKAGRAIAQVQMCLAEGRSVVAVVGSTGARAARDWDASNRLGPTAEPADRARPVVAGVVESAERFAGVLDEIGLSVRVADQAHWPVTRGHALDAEPRLLSAAAYSEALRDHDVLVVPGGVGVDEESLASTSLGADTAPLSALFLGDRLALRVQQACDAASAEGRAGDGPGRRKAMAFSERTGTRAEPAAVDSARTVTPGSDGAGPPARVAAFGAGAVADLLDAWSAAWEGAFEVRRFAGDASGALSARAWAPDVLIDLGADADASYEIASWALRTGRTVITTNTALVAERGGGLGIAAMIGGGELRASGSLTGCAALAPVLGRAATWPGVRRVQGSFSPLGDRVLDLRSQGMSQEEAEAAAAAELGLRSADAARSRDGSDAMETLGAVAQLAFGGPAEIRASPRGPEHVSDLDLARAAAQGRRYRVVATAERVGDQVALRVGPVPLRETDPLVTLEPGVVEAVVETRDGATTRASGRLSHPGSVAAAVLRDLIETRQTGHRRVPSPAANAASGRTGVEPTLGATA
jgi:homoserine dehydrogenase